MKLIWLIAALLFQLSVSYAQSLEDNVESIFGTKVTQKFSAHRPSYFIFGDDDLKIQFSFKYRLSRKQNIYFAYSQLMFWSIFQESRPFEDINYNPEVFYRIFDAEGGIFKTLDIGYLHTSNGEAQTETRSLDRLFLRTNFIIKMDRHLLGTNLMVHHIYDEDITNRDIKNYLGFWDMTIFMTDVLRNEDQRLDLEFRFYAGSKILNIDQGGSQIGLIYHFGGDYINPALYLQRFEGYAENLLNYNEKRTEYRLGLMLSF